MTTSVDMFDSHIMRRLERLCNFVRFHQYAT